MIIKAFIQARMNSSRFPGKMLAPFNGLPMVASVVSRVAMAIKREDIVLLTSREETDTPLAVYAESLNISVFRGELEDCFKRFREALGKYKCDWFFRICGDSPVYNPEILKQMLTVDLSDNLDIVTNVFPRSFPKGNSAELIRTDKFMSIDMDALTGEEREHLTKVYYNHPGDYKINNIDSGNPEQANESLAIDTIEDLRRLEAESEGK